MIIAVDFDGTIVDQSHPYADVKTALRFLHGAKDGLAALRRAGHDLVLYSSRANRATRLDWKLNPGWRTGRLPFDEKFWAANRSLAETRYNQMLEFVAAELPDTFAYVDDGAQGKISADLYIDDRALGLAFEVNGWDIVTAVYGDQKSNKVKK